MNNQETATEIRRSVNSPGPIWSWATDGCGYDQHLRFVKHRNENWKGEGLFSQFCLDYADMLEAEGQKEES